VLVQGLTGAKAHSTPKPARLTAPRIVGGVTPGKGGTTHEGWPIFNTVREPWTRPRECTVIFVPPPYAADAIMEAADAAMISSFASPKAIPTLDMVKAWEFLPKPRSV